MSRAEGLRFTVVNVRHRLRRILFRRAGEPLRQRGLFGGAAQDDAGGDHAARLLGLLARLLEGADQLESSGRLRVHLRWRVFHFSEMVGAWSRKVGTGFRTRPCAKESRA